MWGGTLTYHISKIFPQAKYILSDINPDAIELAKEVNKDIENIEYYVEDFLNTKIEIGSCDLVFCIQTLSWVSHPKKFLSKIIDITKEGGYFILSSLFNTEHDVDIYCKIRDYTRKSNIKLNYNTFSRVTIEKWLRNKVKFFEIIPFQMPQPLEKTTRGMGSYTIEIENGNYLTISGGMLMNWGFLYGRK